jgi:hypothetical protein
LNYVSIFKIYSCEESRTYLRALVVGSDTDILVLVTDLALRAVTSILALLRLRREAITLVVRGDTEILVFVTNLTLGTVTSGLALLGLRRVVTLAGRSVTSLLDLVTDEALHTVLGGLAVLTHLGEGVLYKLIIRKTFLVIVIW